MIDVHLIGYTADLRYVVLDLDAEADGRYRLLIDGDLLATLQEVHELRIDAGLVVPGTPPPGVTSAELDDDGDVEVDDADEATDDDEAIAETDDLEDDDEDEEHEDEDEEHDDEDEEDDDEETFSADAAPSPIPLLRDAAESLERDVAAATEAAGAPLSFIDAHLETDPFEDRIDDRSPFAPPRDAGVGVRIVPRPAEPPPTASLFDEHEVDDEDDELVPSAPRDVGAQTEPEVAEPDAAQPEVAQPEVAQPEVAEPVVAEATARAPEPRPAPPASEVPAPRRSPSPRQRRSPAPPPEPQLSPAEIQALLRSGKSPRMVAEQAGTDEAWIERWLAPILEERARILRDAQSSKLQRPRLGRSRDALGDAVRKSLKRRNVDPDEAAWETSRRTDGRWRVTVRFRHRGKSRTASWVFDPRDRELDAASDLARDLGFTRGRDGAAAKKAAAKGRGSGRAKGGSKRR